MQNKSEEINNHLCIVKMIGVGDKGGLPRGTVGACGRALLFRFLHEQKMKASTAVENRNFVLAVKKACEIEVVQTLV